MTTTDTELSEPSTERSVELEPSVAYEGVYDPAEVDSIFKGLWAEAVDEAGGPMRVVPGVVYRLHEDLRLAHVRIVRRRGKSTSGVTRAPSIQVVTKPTENEDGSLTITCACGCGETMSVKKFPTIKGGGRGSVSRACEARIKAERKAAK